MSGALLPFKQSTVLCINLVAFTGARLTVPSRLACLVVLQKVQAFGGEIIWLSSQELFHFILITAIEQSQLANTRCTLRKGHNAMQSGSQTELSPNPALQCSDTTACLQ